MLVARLGIEPGVMFVFSNLALANRDLPAIIWCFARRTRLANV
jgi:hypothetical protein